MGSLRVDHEEVGATNVEPEVVMKLRLSALKHHGREASPKLIHA